MEIILTHENADFDAVAALLAASKLYPNAQPVLPERLNHNVAAFLTRQQNKLPFVRRESVRADAVSKIIVVDTQRAFQIKGVRAATAIHIIDHHPLGHELQTNETFSSEDVGAVTTFLVEQIRQEDIALDAIEATLLALGIYEDTGSLTYGSTSARDVLAAAWLIERGAMLDKVRRYLSPPLNNTQQKLLDRLLTTVESRVIEGYSIIVAAVTADRYIAEISSVAHRLRDMLDPTALFILVQMPNSLQLVARSTDDAIDVGEIAQLLGGGGHGRAAAAAIHDKTIPECVTLIWQELAGRVHSATRVRDLMSYGVHTVDATQALDKVVRQLRRIGHEGYPVVQDGEVVGLLVHRDLDRAMEHGLGHLTVRDIMTAGAITIEPTASIFDLEQRMVESGWGQVPVVDDTGQLIGIVTRTDLIKYWARIHPPLVKPEKTVSLQQLEDVLGKSPAHLIHTITTYAQEKGIKLYLVGGVVRDLLLSRRNLDVDLVVEGNAIDFARGMEAQFGGQVHAFPPFGTAKWVLDEAVASKLNVPFDQLPDHIDFATARNEYYEHPTALPTVYNSSIKLDLQRRDFTMNTLALQLSPVTSFGQVLDFYGGLTDLEAGIIRVLHSLSFVDDPTRILRAVRFERRLSFTIEPRTDELITSALPMLGRITGERIRSELNLILKETEPEAGLLELQQRGVLKAIHAGFVLDERFVKSFKTARTVEFPWKVEAPDTADLYWHILAIHVPSDQLEGVCERLLFARSTIQSLLKAAQLHEQIHNLSKPDTPPSEIVQLLNGCTEQALLAVWIGLENQRVRDRIRDYWMKWRYVHPVTNGHQLREMGLKQGPCYRIILQRLRDALLDGTIQGEAGERELLDKLIKEEHICDDSP